MREQALKLHADLVKYWRTLAGKNQITAQMGNGNDGSLNSNVNEGIINADDLVKSEKNNVKPEVENSLGPQKQDMDHFRSTLNKPLEEKTNKPPVTNEVNSNQSKVSKETPNNANLDKVKENDGGPEVESSLDFHKQSMKSVSVAIQQRFDKEAKFSFSDLYHGCYSFQHELNSQIGAPKPAHIIPLVGVPVDKPYFFTIKGGGRPTTINGETFPKDLTLKLTLDKSTIPEYISIDGYNIIYTLQFAKQYQGLSSNYNVPLLSGIKPNLVYNVFLKMEDGYTAPIANEGLLKPDGTNGKRGNYIIKIELV